VNNIIEMMFGLCNV
jgi:hypothetical protein